MTAKGICREPSPHVLLRDVAVVIVSASESDNYVSLGGVVADSLDNRAALDLWAVERLKIDRPPILHEDFFGARDCSPESEHEHNTACQDTGPLAA